MAAAEAAFKDVPEIFEVELGESLLARTEALATFRELGPPDLCHVVKGTGRAGQRDLGSYHYVSGIDTSSSASLAAYINSLTYSIEDSQAWFAKGPTWKVKNGCYCCFNAFSRVDVRVDVKIPGGVNAYVIDLRGERHQATPDIWQETYLSAILRAILYSDDPTYFLEAYRRLEPISTPDAELRFLQASEALFMKGWQVGSDPEIQVATILAVREPEVSSLLARSYIGMNEEVKAVQIMANAMKQTPLSYLLLHTQCNFLRSKGKHEWALKLARQAVNCAPSEFVTWEKLTDIYIDLGEYESALLTLNSCPMFTFNGRDSHRNLTALRLAPPHESGQREKTEDDEADPALQRLPAPGLRGTWARAYALLTRLVSQIGWDELLKTRSAVFVMEEEYRMQKAQVDITCGVHASTSASQIDSPTSSASQSPTLEFANDTEVSIPTIRISTESAREETLRAQKAAAAATVNWQPVPDGLQQPGGQESFSFSNKRLCERWLDNLFMVLYEDLRVWTIFRAEVAHFKTQHVAYRKTGLEWEILGDLGLRLHHKEEAKEAFQRALDTPRYSIKPWAKLEGDLTRTLQAAIRVAAYQYGEYAELAYPTQIARWLFKLEQVHGHAKIWNTLLSMGLPEPILHVMQGYLQYGQRFKVEGSDF
ncbi:Chs5p-Arf1p-binding proteins-domain-containing protein [Lactarius deliciosus]|nr:Chs5p-Arf1p-binding proteins-domain-containing protein [Lactarius deliciosus]